MSSTNSHIGILNADKSVDVIYCHWDGYPSGVGATLHEHYTTINKVRALIALGDISALKPSLAPFDGNHSFDHPQEGVTIAYGRDRLERDVDPRHYVNLQHYATSNAPDMGFIEYVYLFDEKKNAWYFTETEFDKKITHLKRLTKKAVKRPRK